MDLKKFSAFKYNHVGSADLSPRRWHAVYIALAAAVMAAIAAFPFGFLVFLVPLGIFFSVPKRLYIGPRYLICGGVLIYFSNVVRLALDQAAGTLTVISANKNSLVLKRDSFPTNARKSFKIAANKAAKFDKVSARIIGKVRQAAPAADVVGVSA